MIVVAKRWGGFAAEGQSGTAKLWSPHRAVHASVARGQTYDNAGAHGLRFATKESCSLLVVSRTVKE
jgi:hypothetical protein